MANPDAPFGFRPYKHVSGGTGGRVNEYPISTAYNTSLFKGDLVNIDGSGNCVIAAAGGQAWGVFWGVKYIAADGSVTYKNSWTADTAEKSGTIIKALVMDDPNQLFLVQGNGSITRADIGTWVDIDTSASGDTSTGWSRQQIGAGGGDTFSVVDVIDSRHQMPCRNAAGNQDFYTTGTNALAVVKIVKHGLSGIAVAEVA